MAAIRTITDPQELTLAQLDEVRAGNERTREEIRRLRRLLKGGEAEEARLKAELVRLATTKRAIR
jgi:hypothetical protein